MQHIQFVTMSIESAGYDPQKTLLEIKFAQNECIWQYFGVPEELWYNLKREEQPDLFFQRHIRGCFQGQQMHFA